MCFLCARLMAVGWWHVAHVLTPDTQVEGHVCIRLAKLAGSDIGTCRLRVRVQHEQVQGCIVALVRRRGPNPRRASITDFCSCQTITGRPHTTYTQPLQDPFASLARVVRQDNFDDDTLRLRAGSVRVLASMAGAGGLVCIRCI